MIVERTDAVFVLEFSGSDLQKIDNLARRQNLKRIDLIKHALNLAASEVQSSTAVIQPEQIRFD